MAGLVQVAGIRDETEARLCLAAGVDLLGFPFRLPVHREDLPEREAAGLIARLGIGPRSVLITYLETAAGIIELADFLGTGWVQAHGRLDPAEARLLKERRPRLRLIRSVVVRGSDPAPGLAEIAAHAAHVDAFLTDSHDPASGADGATGRTHDWAVSRALRLASPRPLWLAGGLHPGNVAQAIAQVGPAGVDAHTGLEDAQGAKDPEKVAAFVRAARSAFRPSQQEDG